MITEGKWTWHDNAEIEIHPVGDEEVGDHTIAVMCEDGYYNREIALANAALIAAAPDLLAACKDLVKESSHRHSPGSGWHMQHSCSLHKTFREAIAKATNI